MNVLVVSHEWNLGFEDLRNLSDAGFRVITASSGFDAIKQFATRPIAAVIVNRRLPDMDVADLTTHFRHYDQKLPIVMVSPMTPVRNAPVNVDAIIAKHDAATLLPSTLQILSRARACADAASTNSLAKTV